MDKEVNFSVTLDDSEAWAVAQFLKRVGWSEMRDNAESEKEAYLIRAGLDKVRTALADAGCAPR